MSTTTTPNLGLIKPTPGTNEPADVSKLNTNSDTVDALFHGTTGHAHTGAAGQGPKIGSGGLASGAATGAVLGADVVTPTGAFDLTNKTYAATKTGASAGGRFVGFNASGAPTTGTFLQGDLAGDFTGKLFIATVAGTPGTWVQVGATSALTTASNILGADVALNNTANYFDGPSMAQGTSGTWFVIGSVTVGDTGTAAGHYAKLWDGTTLIDSGVGWTAGSGAFAVITLAGIITSPAANIRISVRDISSTSGVIKFNASSNSKDSHIWGVKIG